MIDTEDKSVIASEAWKSHKMRLYFDYDFISLYGIATLRSQRHPKKRYRIIDRVQEATFLGTVPSGSGLVVKKCDFFHFTSRAFLG